ncbi:MAG: tetratricopeptide repeat protein, partial [Gemmatimonadota bacterium]|nr:tetratricopeptide repeat protein [Gemmatimonadota bacterium]
LALVGIAALVGGAWWVGTQTGFPEARSEDAPVAAATARPGLADAPEVGADDRPSIAVLPFRDMSPAGDQAYFSDGITEEILNTLVKVDGLKVAARTSAFAFRGEDLDMRAIGDSLDVGYLIEGSVRKAGDQLRITAQLIDSEDGTHLWSEAYNRELDDVFAIQIEIARAIAEALRLPLGLAEDDELVNPTSDLEAYDLYLEGRARIRERGESLREAIRLFEEALAHDSTWAPAWAALAEALELYSWYQPNWEFEPRDGAEALRHRRMLWSEAEAAARRALALDAELPSARVALGSVYRNRREWSAAEREYRLALDLDPDNPEAHQQYADLLGNMGRIREARISAERAVRLDPAPVRRRMLTGILWADGRYDESFRVKRALIAAYPESPVTPALKNLHYLHAMQLGRFEEALEYGPDPWEKWAGATREQHEQMVRALQAGDPTMVPNGALGRDSHLTALTWHFFDEPERALTAIRRTFAESPDQQNIWLWHPVFDPIRQRPEFQEILARLNLDGRTVDRTPRSADEAMTDPTP